MRWIAEETFFSLGYRRTSHNHHVLFVVTTNRRGEAQDDLGFVFSCRAE